MFFRQLFDPDSSTYTYLVGDHEICAVIDPVEERQGQVLEAMSGRRLVMSLDTHVHADHVTASAHLRDITGCKVVMPEGANDCECADLPARDHDRLALGALEIQVLATPGHTPDHLAYLVPGLGVFTGDTLLVGTCGRTDFQGGDAGALWDSIHGVLFALPDATTVWPGHDYKGNRSTTIGAERSGNVRAAGRTRAEFITLMAALKLPPPRRISTAVPANKRCGLIHGA
jgi:glyoxylase-like metal-dependent hydrolase (beta-lactamase superfamily II)